MTTQVYAYLERFGVDGWELADALQPDPDFGDQAVPLNIAPSSWGKRNFAAYYEASGERDLPADLSPGLREFIAQQWDYLNRPSWWYLNEARSYLIADVEQRQAHFDLDGLSARSGANGADLRIVFWADQ